MLLHHTTTLTVSLHVLTTSSVYTCVVTAPVQAQFVYRHKNGGRYMRVITKKKAVSTHRRAMEEVRVGSCLLTHVHYIADVYIPVTTLCVREYSNW